MNRYTSSLLMALCLIHLSTAFGQTNSIDLYTQTSEMNDLMVRFRADQSSILRFYSTNGTRSEWWNRQGNDSYNSPERRQRLLRLVKEYRQKMEALPFDRMSINGKADYLLFDRRLDDQFFRLETEDRRYNEIASLLPFSDAVYQLVQPRRRGAAVNGQQVAAALNDISKQINQSIITFKKSDSLETGQARTTTDAIRGLQGALKDYYSFYYGYDPLFTWWTPATYKEVDSLLNSYALQLTAKSRPVSVQKPDGSGIPAYPAGKEEVTRQLRLEFIPYSVEELIDIATKEFAWCDAEMLKASREMGFGDNWKAAIEKVKMSFVPPGHQPEAMYELYKQSVDFLKKNDLVTIDPLSEEDWSMFMMTPERQKTSPFFLGGESLIMSYPTNTMSYEEKMMSMRGNNPHFSRSTVHHELIAGHHLQGFMGERYKEYRHFDTPFWVEGNALYWELLLWDMHFPRSPEDKVGMLFWRMHRCARIILSLNYHLGKWTPQQCIDFLVDRVGHERANAEAEIRGYFRRTDYALYQIGYMMGGLQFYALKKELVDSKKMTLKQYHDAILRENCMSVEMLRAILTNQPLKRDFRTNWRFYDR